MTDEAAAAEAILSLLDARADGMTICPSEAARRLGADEWRTLMPIVHDAARTLAATGTVVLTQGGAAMPIDAIVGAYRIRKATSQPG